MDASLRSAWRLAGELRLSHTVAIGLISLIVISCAYPARKYHGIDNYPGWPQASRAQGRPLGERPAVKKIVRERKPVSKKVDIPRDREMRKVEHDPLKGPFPEVRSEVPTIPDAEYVREDELCATCHETHTELFIEKNVHRAFSCEECHGPATEHLRSRGQDPTTILDIESLPPAQQSEICLKCHEQMQDVSPHVADWRTSIHADEGLSCNDCHVAHHEVPEGTPTITPLSAAINLPPAPVPSRRPEAATTDAKVVPTSDAGSLDDPDGLQIEKVRPELPSLKGMSDALLADSPETCYRCHDGSYRLTELVGPHKPGTLSEFTCTTCHDASGDLTEASMTDSCLQCHSQPLSPTWHTATHNEANLRCTDCHKPHPDVGPQGLEQIREGDLAGLPIPFIVDQSKTCVECHQETELMLASGDPHQVDGPDKFQCTTCHNPHGKVFESTRKEMCLECHNQELSVKWHTATHNKAELNCTDCHNPHPSPGAGVIADLASEAPIDLTRSMSVDQTKACVSCHRETKLLVAAPDPHQVGGPNGVLCTTCHEPHGQVSDATGTDSCLRCHSKGLSPTWHSSIHNQADLRCSDCHDPHPTVGPQGLAALERGVLAGLPMPMVASSIDGCVRCHEETKQLVEIADPHQVGGPNRFTCATCHDPHGQILEGIRTELCLSCHTYTPTTAWHSSVHHLQGVNCTDCHDPHPDTHVQAVVDIRHTNIRRPERLPMSVNDPDTCYKCHPEIYGLSLMPSRHPIFEGKMRCSSCHNSHGEALGLLNEPQLNLVCYKCHSEFQGPFVYEHPPVTQDCSICHNPHGAIQDNLLHQPPTFLCLRCHSGHRNGPPFHDQALLPDIGNNPALQQAFYSDCTQCHGQVHGSNVPSPNNAHNFSR